MTEITRRKFFALVGAGAAAALVPLPDPPAEPLAAEPVRRAGRPYRITRLDLIANDMLEVHLTDDSPAFYSIPGGGSWRAPESMMLTVKPGALSGIGVGGVIMIEGMG